ncbi:3-oxoacyl-[acyl-carrier-protein] synthase [Pichia californica]|uniref:Fatty acid synthase subunit alpha n=1 Tax=Pichia californica TaxID=460514 RepID=A0A9P6WK09_9ASCO|nr:3-oxoacyl-[acyl-carrier-protein] synthase [[Candida] californica]
MRPEVQQELSHVLLTELLAYQFASPVRWIETQDVFLRDYKTERVVEIGPSPTLAGMATRTIKAKFESYDAALSLQREVLCYSKDQKEIYYTPDPADLDEPENEASPAPVSTPAPVAAAPVAAAPVAAGPIADVADEPIKAGLVLHTLVAHKLKKGLTEIPMSKAIKDLVGGKSTVQNEILGDLGKEFGTTPEKPEDTPLQELADQFQDTFNGSLGKQTSSLIARLMSSKMPGGFSVGAARKYLQSRWGLQSGRQDAVLLHSLTNEPAQRLGSEGDAKAFFDTITQKYAAAEGLSLSSGGSGAAAGGSGGAVIDSAALDAVTKESKDLARQQLETLARYLKLDLTKGDKSLIKEKESSKALQEELDVWSEEHGEFYAQGIKPVFSPLKARTYDSYWNWARQDALSMYFDIIFGKLTSIDRETVTQCIQIMNRANPTLMKFMQYHIDNIPTDKGENYDLAKSLGQQLIDNCAEMLAKNQDPVYKDVSYPTGPKTSVCVKGNVNYEEVPRDACRKFEQYVYEMAQGCDLTKEEIETPKQELAKVYKALAATASTEDQLKIETLYKQLIAFADKTSTTSVSSTSTSPSLNTSSDEGDEIASLKDFNEIALPVSSSIPPETIPFLHIKSKTKLGSWTYDKEKSASFLDGLEKCAVNGVSYKGKCALVTGAGAGSIGAEVMTGLLSGGAKVIVTTSRFSKKVTEYYQGLYSRFGAAGSTLVVVPFNQGSKQDVQALVNFIYDDVKKGGLGWDLDFVIPFAAIPEMGIEVENIGSKSELAHRIMLTNLLRLLGEVASNKRVRNIQTRPAEVILPLSPNHGTFGSDGLYSESKLALETLFNRWYSESWSSFLTICGAVIGWTRGTGLMSGNNMIAEGIEKLGVRTFSQKEMAFNILGLMTPEVVRMCEDGPVMADLNGGLQFIENLREFTNELRTDINNTSEIRRAVSIETAIEHKVVNGENADSPFNKAAIEPKANMKFDFPELSSYDSIKAKAPELEGLLDLDRVIVVTGFSEVGPWGNSRTRWEMESKGEFSLEGCIEMAWIMGYIKYFNGNIKGKQYTGWVDSKTSQPVADMDIKKKYEEQILEHTGIRLIEPELFHGYDPKKKELIQEVVIQHDLEPFVTDKPTALQYHLQHGELVEVFPDESGEEYTVKILKGAKLFIPKALRFDRLVAGQIPTGWNAKIYGISDDIIDQVDPITLYVLVATVEALLSAGVTDPYEFYKYVHVSEVGNCSGSGMGGVSALKGMFKDRYKDIPVQNDILQESFINTMSAWVNMLLLSSSGPIKTPVGACATAIESVDVGVETILSGKAKIVLVGGYDDFQEEGSYEFANMNATSNAVDEFAHGRNPSEMSRPATTSRNGFMEAQGSGIEVLMTASLAVKMGVPIYAIVAMASTATDKIGRSVPAPGKGILTTAKEYHGEIKYTSAKMDIKYRSRQLKTRVAQIKQWAESELEYIQEEATSLSASDAKFDKVEFLKERTEEIERDATRQVKDAQRLLGNEFWKSDPRIAPLRGALATFNLTIDDLGACSFHGTSTKANDKNESATIDMMMQHLGRTEGNPVYGVFQKYLTGHPKGAAGAWMLNGAIQILNSGIVPGNRNADNIDKILEDFKYVLFPSRTIQTDGIKAVSVTSFGFGQKGGQAIVVHPDYLYAALSKEEYNTYVSKVESRQKKSYAYIHNAMITNTMFIAKDHAPYSDDQEEQVYLDPLARVSLDKTNKYVFTDKELQRGGKFISATANKTATVLSSLTKEHAGSKGVGVDVELISEIKIENETFIERNFTIEEIKYCQSAPNPRSSFAGTWSAKEAVFKSLEVESNGAGASLKDIEILHDAKGAPTVKLSGVAQTAASKNGVKNVKVSISHDDVQSVAVAISEF